MNTILKVFRYWYLVLKRYSNVPKSIFDLRAHLLSSLLLLLALLAATSLASLGLVSTNFVKGITDDLGVAALVAVFILAGSFILLLVNLVYQPAMMFDELGGFGDIRLRFLVESQPNRVAAGWVGLNIYNESVEDISGCYVELVAARKEGVTDYRLSRSERLAWSHRHEPINETKIIPPGENKFLDIARTNTAGNLMGWTPAHSDQFVDSSPPGTFEADLVVCGVYKKRAFRIPHTVIIVYRGGLTFASCSDKL